MQTSEPVISSPDAASTRRWWLFYAVAAATFLPVLGFYYVGEEAIFPIASLEMWYEGEWVDQRFLGASLQHPPLYNWLIIPLASVVGWEHMLAVARGITVTATLATGLVIGRLARELYGDTAFATFAAVVYVTLADVFFYRGWLAYVDPLFAFFVVSAIALLWVACRRTHYGLLALAVAALTAAFLSKTLTAYVFYGVTALVLLRDRGSRAFLLSPGAWVLHLLALAAVAGWFAALPANTGQGTRMFAEILTKLAPESLIGYLLKLAAYPLETATKLMPALLLAGYYLWRGRGGARGALGEPTRTVMLIAFINFLPYWLAPQSHTRYLLPIYPLAALVIARILWTAGETAQRTTGHWVKAVIAVKLVVVLVAFPYYQARYRGENFATTARDIHVRAAGLPLYTGNVSASGLSVVAHLDIMRLPQPPLTFPPQKLESGLVITYTADPAVGEVAAHYRLGGNDLYLMCRGAACQTARR